MNTDFIISVMQYIAHNDLHDDISWDEELQFYVNCNDLFHWARADCEPITDDADMRLIKQALTDCNDALPDCDEGLGMALYCARSRQMRPQAAFYKHISTNLHPLFDECGPERQE